MYVQLLVVEDSWKEMSQCLLCTFEPFNGLKIFYLHSLYLWFRSEGWNVIVFLLQPHGAILVCIEVWKYKSHHLQNVCRFFDELHHCWIFVCHKVSWGVVSCVEKMQCKTHTQVFILILVSFFEVNMYVLMSIECGWMVGYSGEGIAGWKRHSLPSPSSILAPSLYPIWKCSWQRQLWVAPWNEPVQVLKLKSHASSPMLDFDKVAEKVHPMSCKEDVMSKSLNKCLSSHDGVLCPVPDISQMRDRVVVLTVHCSGPYLLGIELFHGNRWQNRSLSHPLP